MWSLMPVLVILLALIAAVSIAYIAWELTSDDVQKSIDHRARPDSDKPPNAGD